MATSEFTLPPPLGVYPVHPANITLEPHSTGPGGLLQYQYKRCIAPQGPWKSRQKPARDLRKKAKNGCLVPSEPTLVPPLGT